MSSNAGEPARVLVVEDDPGMLRLVQQTLEEEGYQVTATSGVAGALGLLREQGFDLVLTALFRARGQEPLQSIETLLAAAAPIPVGVMTGWAVEKEAAQAAGVAFLVHKPFNLEELVQAVQQELTLRPPEEAWGQEELGG